MPSTEWVQEEVDDSWDVSLSVALHPWFPEVCSNSFRRLLAGRKFRTPRNIPLAEEKADNVSTIPTIAAKTHMRLEHGMNTV